MTSRRSTHQRDGLRRSGALWWCVLGASLWAGCIAESAHPQPDFPEDAILEPETLETSFEDEVPTLESLGESSVSVDGDGMETMGQPLVGETSRIVPAIRGGLAVANAMVTPGLELLRAITRDHAPILSDADVTVWRVEEGVAVYTFFLEEDEQEARRYNYALLARRSDDPRSTSRVLLSGFFKPGPRTDDGRQTGEGVLRYEYSNLRALFPESQGPTGVGSVAFRVSEEGQELVLFFFNFRAARDAEPLNARYNYTLRPEGGVFSFILRLEAVAESPGLEELRTLAAWDAEGRGRARSVLSSPLSDAELTLDECWDDRQAQVWSRWTPVVPEGEANDGAREACGAFAGDDPVVEESRPVAADELPSIPTGR